MARKRMIDPNIWQSEDFSKLSQLAKIVFIGLFSQADDEGYGRAKAAYVKSTLFPYDENLRVADIEKSLDEIAANMSVTFYKSHNGNEYYKMTNWDKWQVINRPAPSIIPPINDNSVLTRNSQKVFTEQSMNNHGTFTEQSMNNHGTFSANRKEKNRIEIEEKRIYCSELDEQAAEQQNSFIAITLNTGEEYPVLMSDVDEWTKLYPSVDVKQALRNMRGWCLSNPQKRKTKKGVKKFITNWLAKEQDKCGQKTYFEPQNAKSNNDYTEKINQMIEEQQKQLDAMKGDDMNDGCE